MTPRERLLTVLSGQMPDRVPVAPFVQDESCYRALMDGVANAMVGYTAALGETEIDCIGIQGHMAGGATTGPDFFRQYVQPYEKRVIDAPRENVVAMIEAAKEAGRY